MKMRRALLLLVGLVGLQLATTQFSQLENFLEFGFTDPLGFFANNNNFLVQETRAPCISSTGNLEGTCMHAPDCHFSKGTTVGRGNCSVLNTCCTYTKTCNQTVRARVVYFQNPRNPRQVSPCTLTLELLNEDICQIRVDIESLNIEPPTQTPPNMPPPAAPQLMATFTCRERLTVDPNPSDVPIPPICGTVTNNHFYVHLNRGQTGRRTVNINMILLAATAITTSSGTWNIKLTQLECPGRQNKLSIKTKKRNPNQAADDFDQLAPPGCLQYYTQPTGTIQNFGFVSNMVSTIASDQDYAACIKNQPGACGVQYTYQFVMLDGGTCPTNYVAIPENTDPATMLPVPTGDRVCVGPVPTPSPTISPHPGPQYIHVNIGNMLAPGAAGFDIDYDATIANC